MTLPNNSSSRLPSVLLIAFMGLLAFSAATLMQNRAVQQEATTATHAQGEAREQAVMAQTQAAAAITTRGELERELATAHAEQETSQAALYDVWLQQSRFLAAEAQKANKVGSGRLALSLAMKALEHYDAGIFPQEATFVLAEAIQLRPREALYLPNISVEQHSADDSRVLATGPDDTVLVLDVATGATLLQLREDDIIYDARWNRDESLILTRTSGHAEFSVENGYTVRIWDARTGALLLNIPHNVAVDNAFWNTDSTRLLTVANVESPCDPNKGENCTSAVYVWDAKTGENLLTLLHPDDIWSARWNADETLLMTHDWDKTIWIWDAATGELRATYMIENRFWYVAWLGNDQLLITSHDNSLREINALTGVEQLRLQHPDYLWTFDYSEDGRILTITENGLCSDNEEGCRSTLHFWDRTTGKELATAEVHFRIESFAWDSTRQYLALATGGGVYVVDGTTGEALMEWDGEMGFSYSDKITLSPEDDETIDSVTWSKDSRYIIGVGRYDVYVWELKGWHPLFTLRHEGSTVDRVHWNDDLTRFITSADNITRVWEILPPQPPYTTEVDLHAFDVYNAVLNEDNTSALVSGGSSFLVIDLTHRIVRPEDHYIKGRVHLAQWSANERRILLDSGSGAQILDTATLLPLITMLHDENEKTYWSPAENWAITSSAKMTRLWDATTGQLLKTITDVVVQDVFWHEHGARLLAKTTDSATIQVWELNTGELLLALPADFEDTPKWSADGSAFAYWQRQPGRCEKDCTTLQIWQLNPAEKIADYTFYHGRNAVWHPHEKQLLMLTQTCRECGEVLRIWDANTGLRQISPDAKSYFGDAIWSSDGTRILTNNGSTAQVWDARSGELLREVSGIVGDIHWKSDGSRLIELGGFDDREDFEPEDFPIKIWNVEEERIELYLPNHYAVPAAFATWNKDASLFLLVADRTLYVWSPNFADYYDRAQFFLSHDLSNAEREQYYLSTLVPSSTPTELPALTPTAIFPSPTLFPPVTPFRLTPTPDVQTETP